MAFCAAVGVVEIAAVVGSEEHEGVIVEAELLQRRHDLADTGIQRLHHLPDYGAELSLFVRAELRKVPIVPILDSVGLLLRLEFRPFFAGLAGRFSHPCPCR
jgi:hypothetical protein